VQIEISLDNATVRPPTQVQFPATLYRAMIAENSPVGTSLNVSVVVQQAGRFGNTVGHSCW
jgi:hypothetical protein